MKNSLLPFLFIILSNNLFAQSTASSDSLIFAGEKHFKNVKQLTFGGDNAEAYWSFDGRKLVYQFTNHKDIMCDQIFVGTVPSGKKKFNSHMVSTGKGRTTCAYFLPGDSLMLFASTHANADSCPPTPDKVKLKKYVWPVYNTFEIYSTDLKGNIRKQLTSNNFYDAEATISPKGDRMVFTSDRCGDLELYTMNLDGSDVKQITNTLGYDGGAWFSPDGKKIVWRASRPTSEAEVEEYKSLLSQGLVAPSKMEVFIANADGSDVHQVTDMPGANWAPSFTPDGKKIIFSSNYEHAKGFPFNLYIINVDGTGLEKISYSNTFDAFAMFSPDGKKLVFCSNRHNGGGHDTNIFVADWVK